MSVLISITFIITIALPTIDRGRQSAEGHNHARLIGSLVAHTIQNGNLDLVEGL